MMDREKAGQAVDGLMADADGIERHGQTDLAAGS